MSNPSGNYHNLQGQNLSGLRYNRRISTLIPEYSQDIEIDNPENEPIYTNNDTQFSSAPSVKDENFTHSRDDHSEMPSQPTEKKTEAKATESLSYPPLFIGVNIPGERPGIEYSYTDETLVERSLLEEYDMITSRISTPTYRARVEALFAENEELLKNDSHQLPKPSSAPMPPPASPQRLQPLQLRPLRNENSGYGAFARSSSLEGSSSSIKSNKSANSAGWLDRGSPAPSLFSANKFAASITPSPLASNKSSSQPTHSLPFNSFEAPPLEFDDILLLPGAHIRNVIALTAPWVELDSKNPRIASLSSQVILREIAYGLYCGVTYFVICGPKRRTNIEQYSQAISQFLAAIPPYCHLLVHLPLAEEDHISSRTGERVPPTDYLSIWDVWSAIRVINDYPPNLSVVLQVPPRCNFPSVVVSRWYAEPVKMLMISSAIFVGNARGYPVLPKATQALLLKFFSKSPFLILSDVYDRDFQGGLQSYLLYVRHLVKLRPRPSAVEAYSEGYSDLLQSPLQPLVGNLESSTYEVFERDPVKYAQYEKAIYKALQSILKTHIYVAVVGAGRGPLVERVLTVANHLGKRVHIYAIEKNESACIHLNRRVRYEWRNENVNVVTADMRTWRPKGVRFSLIISELLGSFGDNELSPECLDGLDAGSLLDPVDGIIIPQSYSAFFTPVMSPTLYNAARKFKAQDSTGAVAGISARAGAAGLASVDGRGDQQQGNNSALQTPYVVMLNSIDFLSPGQFGQAWTFNHPCMIPTDGSNFHNTRKAKHTFTVPHQGIMHGIAGYFESTLFGDVQLSTRPDSNDGKSKDMLSWFPIWFPLSSPLYIAEGSEIDVSMWRLTDDKRVWYEWTVETYYKTGPTNAVESSAHSASLKHRRRVRVGMTALHNANGQHFSMTL